MDNLKLIKELTGTDARDMFGMDAENIVGDLTGNYYCECNAKLITEEEQRTGSCRLCR